MRPVKYREPWVVGILSFFTFGFFNFYLIYSWAKELNYLNQKKKFSPGLTLILAVVTLGLSGTVFESVYSVDLEKHGERAGVEMSLSSFSTVIISLNVAALVLCLIPFGFVIGFPVGVVATVFMQREMNRWVPPEARRSVLR